MKPKTLKSKKNKEKMKTKASTITIHSFSLFAFTDIPSKVARSTSSPLLNSCTLTNHPTGLVHTVNCLAVPMHTHTPYREIYVITHR